ncbi:uncharacterized protein AMSG_03379 [Thecamonas trahens ATCC 50062]|uniref:Uncharacterized protein n=1 Tax=Thecamonas trahens ATCC 50062 TaxID=461836 RepID=A0A0L0D3X8_THETB|nr:hypothetical protein AMSG_03379 [Thecamonas trahens ATCC 50062]KNC46945.1 hypothetical protein AMSG_03379 [Thecamonas trahens ATCC 50062]|eukprot:XP_013760217.1 hypothetical protein AMSG_03379 [Thecamonas trahens ATCC 50062]
MSITSDDVAGLVAWFNLEITADGRFSFRSLMQMMLSDLRRSRRSSYYAHKENHNSTIKRVDWEEETKLQKTAEACDIAISNLRIGLKSVRKRKRGTISSKAGPPVKRRKSAKSADNKLLGSSVPYASPPPAVLSKPEMVPVDGEAKYVIADLALSDDDFAWSFLA